MIFVRDDGLFDKAAGGNKISINGISFDHNSYTLTLDNVSIGEIYNGPLRHDKKGTIVFMCSGKEKTDQSGRTETVYPDYTVELKGHNYLGGYSTFERLNCHVEREFVDSGMKDSDGNKLLYEIQRSIQASANSISFTGDGDIIIHGMGSTQATGYDFTNTVGEWYSTGISLNTTLPIWYSMDDEGKDAVSVSNIYEYGVNNGFGIYDRYNENGDPYYINPNHNPLADSKNNQNGVGYMKIGGEKADALTRPLIGKTARKDLGIIGGHSVSVCYTDNFVYDGRKIDSSREAYHTKSKRFDFYLSVSVDGVSYDNEITADMDAEDKKRSSVKVRYKNNRDVSHTKNGKTVSPCFAFSISKKSGLESSFIKALNSYFKNKDNWIGFNILPEDIKYADTSFLGVTGYYPKKIKTNMHYDESVRKKQTDYKNKLIGKNLKINGDTVKNMVLYSPRTGYGQHGECSKKLKADKKYNESNPNIKKDFHTSVSGDHIVITGQGNYCGTIIVDNPDKTAHLYWGGDYDLLPYDSSTKVLGRYTNYDMGYCPYLKGKYSYQNPD